MYPDEEDPLQIKAKMRFQESEIINPTFTKLKTR